jgi:hypothetical protein
MQDILDIQGKIRELEQKKSGYVDRIKYVLQAISQKSISVLADDATNPDRKFYIIETTIIISETPNIQLDINYVVQQDQRVYPAQTTNGYESTLRRLIGNDSGLLLQASSNDVFIYLRNTRRLSNTFICYLPYLLDCVENKQEYNIHDCAVLADSLFKLHDKYLPPCVTMRVELCTLRDVSQLPSPSIYSLRIPTDQFSCTYDPFVITNEYRVRDIAMIKEDFFYSVLKLINTEIVKNFRQLMSDLNTEYANLVQAKADHDRLESIRVNWSNIAL